MSAVKLPNIKISPKTAIYASEINASMSEMPTHFRKKSQNNTLISVAKSKSKEKDKDNKN